MSKSLATKTLYLPLKGEYFNAIKSGEKVEEFRAITPRMKKRIEGRDYDKIILTLGYPKRSEHSKRIERKWLGYEIKTITHPHFGPEPVQVYAIKVNK